jgi:hypothetical protein
MGIDPKAEEKKKVYRKGDTVRIVTPEFFVRCGYERNLSSEIDVVLEKFTAGIQGLMLEAGVPEESRTCRHRETTVGRVLYRIAAELAHARLQESGYGSKTRKIYTAEEPEYAGRKATVWGKKTVKTGRYYAPYGWGDDYEPGGLDNEQTHVILYVQVGTTSTFKWIEAKNVEAIKSQA